MVRLAVGLMILHGSGHTEANEHWDVDARFNGVVGGVID
jgi:hypothetical protein